MFYVLPLAGSLGLGFDWLLVAGCVSLTFVDVTHKQVHHTIISDEDGPERHSTPRAVLIVQTLYTVPVETEDKSC